MSGIRADAKNVKKEYVRSRFVDAAKSIIIREGVLNVTVRKIAELTGYSYATIYHYFSDLGELLLETKLSMIRDMVSGAEQQTARAGDSLQRINEIIRLPVDYFIDNPNVYRFFYSYEMDPKNEAAMKSLDLEKAYYDEFLPLAEKGIIRRQDIKAISRTILYSVFGMITLYLSGNGLTKEEIYTDIDNMTDIFLKRNAAN